MFRLSLTAVVAIAAVCAVGQADAWQGPYPAPRMQRAQMLLETSNNTLEVIGQDLGFSDGLVFSRAFKRWIGMNPRDYRARK